MTLTETALVTTAGDDAAPRIPGRKRRYTEDQVTLPLSLIHI